MGPLWGVCAAAGWHVTWVFLICRFFLFLCNLFVEELRSFVLQSFLQPGLGVVCLWGAPCVLLPALSPVGGGGFCPLPATSALSSLPEHLPSTMFIYNTWHHSDHRQSDFCNQFKIVWGCVCYFAFYSTRDVQSVMSCCPIPALFTGRWWQDKTSHSCSLLSG